MFIIESKNTKQIEDALERAYPELTPDDREIAKMIMDKIEQQSFLSAFNLTVRPSEKIDVKLVLTCEEMRVVLSGMEIVR